MPRRPFIAGNWKMNLGPSAADELARGLRSKLVDTVQVDVAIAPPAISIPAAISRLKHTGVFVAGQDLHPNDSGAHTGCLAGPMLRDAGCQYVIVGHSERRRDNGETNELVGQKVHAALRSGLLPIFCVGETLKDRDSGQATQVVEQQLSAGFAGLSADQAATVTIAYEPVWAIGTGRAATPDLAQAMHASIRAWLRGNYPPFVADSIRIQYGGSVKPGNARALLQQPDIDGALVGGASLVVDSFVAIVDAATRSGR
jgi:triosephosphate isomerase